MVKLDWRDRPLSEKRPIMKAEESSRLEGYRA
jgi:hypothetical protein